MHSENAADWPAPAHGDLRGSRPKRDVALEDHCKLRRFGCRFLPPSALTPGNTQAEIVPGVQARSQVSDKNLSVSVADQRTIGDENVR